MFAPGVSTRKVGKVLEKVEAARLSEGRVSRICFELDAEVSELRGRDLSGQRFLYLWVDATYVPCRRGGHGATAAVVTAVAVGEDGIRRVVGLACVDSESYAVNVNPSFTDSTNAIAPIAPTHPRRFRRRQAPFPASRSGARSFVR